MRSSCKLALRFLVVLEWVVVFVIAMEAFETIRAFAAERAYKDYFDAQNRKVYGMAPADELAHPRNQFSLAKASVAGHTPRVPGERTASLGADVRQQGRDAFAALSDGNRNIIATLRGETTLVVDSEGWWVSSWGEPLVEQYLLLRLRHHFLPDGWKGWLGHAVRTKASAVYEMRLEEPYPIFLEVRVAPEEVLDGLVKTVSFSIRDVTSTKPLALRRGSAPVSEDSAWEIPFYAYKKHWRALGGDVMTTNNAGFRDRDVVLPKPAGVFRIVCIGGSTTEEGNTVDTTYPNIMERKLSEVFGATVIDVVNAGICGMDTCTERRRIDDYLALEPDLLLLYVGVNDLCHRHFAVWLEQAQGWQQFLRRSRFLARYGNRLFLPPDAALEHFLNQTTMRNVGAIRFRAREAGVAMAVCSFAYPRLSLFDLRARNYYDLNMREVWKGKGVVHFRTYCEIMDLYNRLLEDWCGRNDAYYIPLAENFDAGPDHFFDICHMTPLGLELKTNIIGAYVARYVEEHAAGLASSKDTIRAGRSSPQ